MEKSDNSLFSAKHEIEQTHNVKIHPIVNLDDIIRAIDNGVISANEQAEKLRKYAERYRGI